MSRGTAAGLYKIVTLAGKEYKAGRWGLVDFAAWEEWVRYSYRKRALEGSEVLSEGVREKLELEVYKRAAQIVFVSSESMLLLSTVAGFVRAWYMALVKNHPELTEDDVADFLLHPDTDYKELERLEILGDSGSKKKPRSTPRKKARKASPPMYRKATP